MTALRFVLVENLDPMEIAFRAACSKRARPSKQSRTEIETAKRELRRIRQNQKEATP